QGLEVSLRRQFDGQPLSRLSPWQLVRAASCAPPNEKRQSEVMFIFPVLLSLSLDIAVVAVYFREGNLYGREKGQPWVRLLDVSACNFDLAVLATLRILFISPYIYSYVHRRRLVYTFLPWAWEALNMGIVTARLVFLVAILVASRAEYLLVGLSFASILLQAVCLEHLRSSAPREKHIFLTSALSRVDASTRLLEHHQPAAPGAGGQDLYDGHRRDVDFIASITAKMKRAKEYWTAKTESLRGLWNDLGRARGGEAAAFNLLLRLFTYEDVLGDMDEAFAQEPSSVEFYIPQLATFLLYGAFWSSGSLQAFLLDKSARSIQFAHRLYWFLLASCLDGSGIDQEGRRQVGTLIEEVRSRGQRAARRLEQGRTVQELYPSRGSSSALQRPTQASRRWGRGTRSR
ncbi:phosphatidylinositol kinase (pik-k), partial [Nannochloropsis gaditana CCMP526]|uniref:phosphatidylinositol kinase (pik-k) n=1 Tax=Nannochloropsis gaditana (strain CCMP526) TaxID=1093141 RepID=UPI00029F68E1